MSRRTPRGVRGLKLRSAGGGGEVVPSHPSRGAWIEIEHAPIQKPYKPCRTPRGVRGLKYHSLQGGDPSVQSHPSRGAWIEILALYGRWRSQRSHPSRGAWIEISQLFSGPPAHPSHPSRGAWIEIPMRSCPGAISSRRTPRGVRGLKFGGLECKSASGKVAPLAGCVD